MRSHSHWKNIVDNVEHANLQLQKQYEKQRKLRQLAYNSYLDQQVKQRQQQYQHNRQTKSIQRQQIQQAYNQEYNKSIRKRAEKMKTQLNYQKDNLQLLQQRNTKHETEKFPQHPFVKLLDKEKNRLQLTRQKFQLQNYLNSIQEDMKKEKRAELKVSEKKLRTIFENHVEDEYQHRIQERKAFEKKYLTLSKNDKQLMQSYHNSKKNNNNEYLDFLIYQSQQHKKSIYENNNLLDARLQTINKNTEKGSASPAYLGRNPFSYDRGIQLEYLDRSLNDKKIKEKKNQVSSSAKQSQSNTIIKYLPPILKNNDNRIQKQSSINPQRQKEQLNEVNRKFQVCLNKQIQKNCSPINQSREYETKNPTPNVSATIKKEKKMQTKRYNIFDVITSSKKVFTMQTQIN